MTDDTSLAAVRDRIVAEAASAKSGGTNMSRQHIDDLLWSVFQEAESLLRDLEAVEGHGDLATAGRYIDVITTHIEPLRRRIEAVECHERDDALAEDAALSSMGPL